MKTIIRTLQAYRESQAALKATKKRMQEVSNNIAMYSAIIAMPPRVDAKTYLITHQ